jgi:hypothetical protein
MNLSWFYFHVVLALVILYKDHNGTLEESLNNFEKKIGLYTYVDTTEDIDTEVPYYIPPTETEIDSSFILPDSLKRKRRTPLILPPIRDNDSIPDSNMVNNNLAFNSFYHPYPIDDSKSTKNYKPDRV